VLLLIPLLPFAGFLINAGLGRRIGRSAAGAVACAAIGASFLVAGLSVWRLVSLPAGERALVEHAYDWITSGDFNAPLTLRLDPLSAVMILVVAGIGSIIHVYSTAYMSAERDSEYARYFSYLNLFAAFMLLLVLGSNFPVLFVGWEGVGLCSYLLIGFWYEKPSASAAGMKAFVVNRIGDSAFLLGLFAAFVRFGTLDFQEIGRQAARLSPEASFGAVSLITLLLVAGAVGKSAQLPLYVWLPDAMEGPTPVSALIHAATMVTAGVYMMARNAVLFSHAPETLAIVATIGAATALMAGSIGLAQNDIKRVLAYSTISQLGYMFLAVGVGAFASGIFHLYTHAFFKALLFLAAGAVIHALDGEQDLRRMGGLKRDLPLTYGTFLIGALAIAGVPGLSGFFSKDEILFHAYASGHTILWALALFTALLTAIYMFRVVFLAFYGARAAPGPHLHDAPPAMALALILLAVGSVVAGYVGVGGRFERFLEPSLLPGVAPGLSPQTMGGSAAGVEALLTVVSSVTAAAGILIAAYFFLTRRSRADELAARFAGLYRVLLNKYYVDEIYDAAVVQPIRIVSEEGLWKRLDVGVIDRAVDGIGDLVLRSSAVLRRLQTGSVRAYAASLFAGVVLILGYYLWR
jgi:NADH-quinone oxidoreductase subunit L